MNKNDLFSRNWCDFFYIWVTTGATEVGVPLFMTLWPIEIFFPFIASTGIIEKFPKLSMAMLPVENNFY